MKANRVSYVLTKAMKINMRLMRKEGYTLQEIATQFGVSEATVRYHLNPKRKAQVLQQAKAWREKNRDRFNETQRKSHYERYHNDPVFRARMLRANNGGFYSDTPRLTNFKEISNIFTFEEIQIYGLPLIMHWQQDYESKLLDKI